MTATRTRPAGSTASRRTDGTRPVQQTAVRRTLLALLAAALGIVPLEGLFSDFGWLPDVWLSMAIVIAPAVLLRRRSGSQERDVWTQATTPPDLR